jgi:Domain of unknown function (DUF6754)
VNLVNILISSGGVGLVFVLAFAFVMVIYAVVGRNRPGQHLRDIPAFTRLGRAIGLAVESGTRMHITLGWGGITDLRGASALIGLTILERIARLASISDRPPVATSGDGILGILSQDTLSGTYKAIGAGFQYDPTTGRVSGLTPVSYSAGAIPVIYDEHVSATVLAGHFGSEAALITDAAERNDSLTLAGSDSITSQAVFAASAQEPLIGEELFAAGAYINAGPLHASSLRAQDIFRWVLVAAILVGAILKLVGVL